MLNDAPIAVIMQNKQINFLSRRLQYFGYL